MLELTTDKDVRGYQDQNGRFFPSTGAVLDLLFPGQMQWIDQAALDEGTRCHEDMKASIYYYLEHQRWPPSHANPRVQALIHCLQEHNLVPLEAEQPHCSFVYGYAGTPDALLGRMDERILPDWKFAESLDERYSFQLEAYRPFYKQGPLLMLFQVDRAARVKPVVVRPSAKRWGLFLNALAVLKFRLR